MTDTNEKAQEREADRRFAYYSLGVQAVISVVVLIFSFWLIATPTETSTLRLSTS